MKTVFVVNRKQLLIKYDFLLPLNNSSGEKRLPVKLLMYK